MGVYQSTLEFIVNMTGGSFTLSTDKLVGAQPASYRAPVQMDPYP